MTMTIRVVFDGEVFRPTDTVDLRANTSYTIVLESDPSAPGGDEEHRLLAIARLAVDMGVDDLSVNHDRYAHGRVDAPHDGQ